MGTEYRTERGQILVMFSIIVVGMLAILALAIDGGYGYAIRRAAQNAADAGALAGARYYCAGQPEWVWKQAAADYVEMNHNAETVDIRLVGANNNLVYVKTGIEQNAFFSGILGNNSIRAEADAEAGCYIPLYAEGVLPIGWACKAAVPGDNPYTGYGASTSSYKCDVLFRNPWVAACADDNVPGCYTLPDPPPGPDDEPLYLIMDNAATADGDIMCADSEDDVGIIDGILYIDCDLDNDGRDEALAEGGRGWLDLNGSAGGGAELTDWIRNGYPYKLSIHTWVPQEGGDKASLYTTVKDYRLGRVVALPVFDDLCVGDPSLHCDGPEPSVDDKYHNAKDTVETMPSGQKAYHIIGYIQFFVTCVKDKPSTDCPGFTAFKEANETSGVFNNGDFQKMRTIEGFFVTGFMHGAYGKGEEGGPDLLFYTVYLNK